MGEATVVAFGVLAILGFLLLALGALRRNRSLMVGGGVILLALVGVWMAGLPGTLAGVLPLAFLRRGRTGVSD